MKSHSSSRAGTSQSKSFLLLVGLMAAAAVTMVAILLFPPSESEDDPDLTADRTESEREREGESATDAGEVMGKSRLIPGDETGELVELTGSLFINGSALADVGIEAFVNMPEPISTALKNQIKSSPLYYSARARKIIEETGLDAKLGRHRMPRPSAACRTESNGSFEMTLSKSRTVTFRLDHDFYYLARDEAGPHSWSTQSDEERLDGFDGRLEAELGALVRGTVTDHEDLPLEGVTVELFAAGQEGGGGRFFGRGRGADSLAGQETITDDRGRFVLRGVEPDREIRLRARIDGYAAEQSKIFEARPGEVHRELFRLGEGSTIRVQVQGPEGGPLRGAEVYLEKEEEGADTGQGGRGGRGMRGFGMFGGVTIADAGKTGSDGAIIFQSLFPGLYHVKACFPGAAEARTESPVALSEDLKTAAVQLALSRGRSISGVVIDDLDRPVGGASIQALLHTRTNFGRGGGRGGDFGARLQAATAPPGALKQTESSANGTFLITGLSEDTAYDLFAQAENLVPAETREVDLGTSDVVLVMTRHGQIRGRVIAAGAGDPVTRFTIRTVPAPDDETRGDRGRGQDRGFGRGRDQGQGRGPGSGRGPDSGRNETSNAVDSLMRSVGELMWRPLGPSVALTDREEEFKSSAGQFSLKEIVPGRYRLCVAAGGFEPRFTEPFVVEKGAIRDDLTVDLALGASIHGKVLSSFGPVKDARVSVRAERGQDRDLDTLLGTLKELKTDREGKYVIDSLPPGKFTLRAEHPDFPTVSTDPLELAEGQTIRSLNIIFPPAARIVGVAIDEAGIPLDNQVIVCRSREERRGASEMERTDRAGRFEFDGLRAGTYSVGLSSRGMGFRMRGGGDEGFLEVKLVEGAVAEIVVQRKPPEGVIVQGVITDGSGAVGRGVLTVSPAGNSRREATRTGAIEEDGTYKVEGVTPGTNRFTVRFMTSESFESTSLDFDIPDLQSYLLDIPLPGNRISGVILDELTRLPLGDVRVSLSEEGESTQPQDRRGRGRWGSGRSVTTDKDGTFQFRLLTEGTYQIEARPGSRLTSSEGFRYYSREISGLIVTDGRSLDNVEILVGPGGGIEVMVVDANNNPVDGASVTATLEGAPSSADSRGGLRGRTDGEGKAVIDRVEPGLYTLIVQARQSGQQVKGGVAVASGQYRLEQVMVESGFQVSVRLLSGDGQPVTGASVTLKNTQGFSLSVPRGRGGRNSGNVYSLGTLSPGQYTIEAAWDDTKGSARFSVSSGGTIEVTLR